METAQQNEKQEAELGLSLNKKTMLAITLVLVAILVFVGVLTQVLPRGEYEVTQIDGHESIVNGTYHELDYRMPIWKIVLSPLLCFTSSQATTGIAIILIIILIGGSFLILDKVGVLRYIMASLIRKFNDRKYLLMAIVLFVCMALASTAGILEESALGTSQDYEIQQVLRHAEKKFAIGARFAKFKGMTIEAGKTAIKPTLGNFQSFVSMGFGNVLWATGNLSRFDASQPIGPDNYYIEHPLEAGDYFKYGATAVYANTDNSEQTWEGEGISTLPSNRDIASIVSNGSWRIPDPVDFYRLYFDTYCQADYEWKTEWTTMGTEGGGMLFTSRQNGISIFFAAAGDYDDGTLRNFGSFGYYRTCRTNGNTQTSLSISMRSNNIGNSIALFIVESCLPSRNYKMGMTNIVTL